MELYLLHFLFGSGETIFLRMFQMAHRGYDKKRDHLARVARSTSERKTWPSYQYYHSDANLIVSTDINVCPNWGALMFWTHLCLTYAFLRYAAWISSQIEYVSSEQNSKLSIKHNVSRMRKHSSKSPSCLPTDSAVDENMVKCFIFLKRGSVICQPRT